MDGQELLRRPLDRASDGAVATDTVRGFLQIPASMLVLDGRMTHDQLSSDNGPDQG